MQQEFKRKFNRFYQDKIQPKIYEREKERKQRLLKHKIAEIALSLAVLAFVPVFIYAQVENLANDPVIWTVYWIIIGVFVFAAPFYYSDPRKFYKENTKVFIDIFKTFWEPCVLELKKGINKSVILKSQIVTQFSKMKNRLFFKKNFNNVEVEVLDGLLETGDEEIFNGVFAKLTLPKSYNAKVLILGYGASLSDIPAVDLNLSKSNLENRYYSVYFDNLEFANSFVNPELLKYLDNIKTIFKSTEIRVFLENNELYLAMPVFREEIEFGDLYKTITDNGLLEKITFEIVELFALTTI